VRASSSYINKIGKMWVNTIRKGGCLLREMREAGERAGSVDELGLSLSRPCVFERVVLTRFRLGQGQIKLFRAHPKFHGASLTGTVNSSFDLESSNLLCELLAALWTLEWPNVLVLVHEGYSDRVRSMRHLRA
jgi:hypothetical protein